MEDFVNKLKKGAATAVDEAHRVTKNVMKMSTDAVNQTKLKFAIRENEQKITELLASIGQYVYSTYKEGVEFESDINDKCSQVSVLQDEISALNERIAELKNNVICQECGEYNKSDSTYCSKCGNKLN